MTSTSPHPRQLELHCQRWHHRRASYRPAGEIFDPRRAGVEPIEERDAKAFVEKNHYSASYPARQGTGPERQARRGRRV